MLQGCRLFKQCRNLLAGTVLQGCRLLKQCRYLLARTVLQGCSLFKWCQKLPALHCVAGVQAVKGLSEPICQALCCRGAGCLSGVETYLPGMVL